MENKDSISKQNTELMLKHLQEQLDEIRKERENLAATVEKLMQHHNFEEADDEQKRNLEIWKQEVDEHSKIAVEHLKMLEKHLQETKQQYLNLQNRQNNI